MNRLLLVALATVAACGGTEPELELIAEDPEIAAYAFEGGVVEARDLEANPAADAELESVALERVTSSTDRDRVRAALTGARSLDEVAAEMMADPETSPVAAIAVVAGLDAGSVDVTRASLKRASIGAAAGFAVGGVRGARFGALVGAVNGGIDATFNN